MWHVSLKHRKCVTVSVVGSTSSSYTGSSRFKFWPRYQFFQPSFSWRSLIPPQQACVAQNRLRLLPLIYIQIYQLRITPPIIHTLPYQSFTNYPSNHLHIIPLITHKLPHISFTNFSTNYIQITLPVISDLPDLFTKLPYQSFTDCLTTYSSQITPPVIHKLPYQPFSN